MQHEKEMLYDLLIIQMIQTVMLRYKFSDTFF